MTKKSFMHGCCAPYAPLRTQQITYCSCVARLQNQYLPCAYEVTSSDCFIFCPIRKQNEMNFACFLRVGERATLAY